MQPKGGTEIIYENLIRCLGNEWRSKLNLIISTCDIRILSSTLPNILWQHLNYNEENVRGLADRIFVDSIDKFIFVSNWQKDIFHQHFDFPSTKSQVIANAIEPIEFLEKSQSGRLKLIYTSTPWRGLDVLLDAFKILNRDDIELDVYSSTVIYGKEFLKNKFDWLFDRCRSIKNVNYRGYALNKAVRKAVQNAHIFSYPSTFEETSCLSAIEAGAAGCRIVTTDLGALPETCGEYAIYCKQNSNNRKQLAESYAEILNREIDNYWNNYAELKEQSQAFNNKYSWSTRQHQWATLFEEI